MAAILRRPGYHFLVAMRAMLCPAQVRLCESCELIVMGCLTWRDINGALACAMAATLYLSEGRGRQIVAT